MKFSIVVVSFNPGELIIDTLKSIYSQSFTDYEIIVKDAGSKDGTKDRINAFINENGYPLERLKYIEGPDGGIYDGMNLAVREAQGDFVMFINCGDYLYDENVLKKIADKNIPGENTIAYGDAYFRLYDSIQKAASKITGSVCYRNIPCHQAIVYSRDTVSMRGFDTRYRIRADYEHFLYSFYRGGRSFVYLNETICNYQGGGYSENAANKKRDKEEYSEIVRKYIPLADRFRYRAFLILTLHKVRGAMARSTRFSKFYQKLKGIVSR